MVLVVVVLDGPVVVVPRGCTQIAAVEVSEAREREPCDPDRVPPLRPENASGNNA